MKRIYSRTFEQLLTDFWSMVGYEQKKAFLVVLGVNILAFGFEITNLSLHHDDVSHIFIQDDILGHYLGRFGFGWLHYYTQNGYFMPFLQMLEGIVLMSVYGVLVSSFWGARNALDMILVSSVLCVFPYMAQIYQYNTSMYPFALAHLLAASAVVLSTRATIVHVAIAALVYTLAFSIYQGVIANAATIFCVWVLCKILFSVGADSFFSRETVKSAIAAFLSVCAGGVVYMVMVSAMDLKFDSYQSAGQAFDFKDGFNLVYAITEILNGTRSFFFWPQNYFPDYLVKLQLLFVVCAGVICAWLPKNIGGKISAVVVLVVAIFAPRTLQLIHPEGNYHNLTLTAYAAVIAGSLIIINRAGYILVRNLSVVATTFLIAGYVMQCNWISTVNYLNTMAHYTTMTQVLSRVRALPDESWDGRKIAVVGNYNMHSDYPYKSATGVAVKYMDAVHMQHLAKLMRDDVSIVEADDTTPGALEYAATHPGWPHPASVGIVDGMGVVVFSGKQTSPH